MDDDKSNKIYGASSLLVMFFYHFIVQPKEQGAFLIRGRR